jgi:hypothetical protein
MKPAFIGGSPPYRPMNSFYQIKETALVKQENERQREREAKFATPSPLAQRPGKWY